MAHHTEVTADSRGRQRIPRWSIVAVAGLLAIHVTLVIDTLRQKSVTVDEVGHLPAGISYWQQRTFELYHHNPPLVKLIAALPVLAANPVVDYSKSWDFNRERRLPLSQWAFGWEFMYANAARYQELYVLGRMPVLLFSVLAALVIFAWANELFGAVAGVASVALWSFCPNVIAHAGLVTTDLGATSLGFVASYLFWRYLRSPSWSYAFVAGLVLGFAQLTKFSLVILYLTWPAVWLIWILVSNRSKQCLLRDAKRPGTDTCSSKKQPLVTNQSSAPRLPPPRTCVAQFVAILFTSVLVINAGYFFEGSGTQLGSFQFLSRSLTRPRVVSTPAVPPNHPWHEILQRRENRFARTWLASVPVPLPRHYVEGFDEQKLESEGINGQGYPVYLRGELRRTGWWWYYLYALGVKVPLGTWLITVGAVVTALLRQSARANWLDELVLIVPALIPVLVLSFLTDINLGLRYVLPIFPFWFVLVSRVACWPVACTPTRSVSEGAGSYLRADLSARQLVPISIVLAAFGWNVARCAWIHPHHLAYFNELVGPRNGYRHLIDSNLDWGQDLLALQAWLDRNRPGERVGLAYFGNVDPSILAASGHPLRFVLAPPRRLDDLQLVATKPDGELFTLRKSWIDEHTLELQSWLRARHEHGESMNVNEHPGLRALAIDHLGLSEGPQAGLYAISANLVAGLPFRVRDHGGNLWNAEQDAYSYFRSFDPIAQIGYSIFIYEIAPEAGGGGVGFTDFNSILPGKVQRSD